MACYHYMSLQAVNIEGVQEGKRKENLFTLNKIITSQQNTNFRDL